MALEHQLTMEGRKRRFFGGLAMSIIPLLPFISLSFRENAYFGGAFLGLVSVVGFAIVIALPFRKIDGRYITNDWISITSYVIVAALIILTFVAIGRGGQ